MTEVLVHDYRTGDVIDAESGEVVGRIYMRSPVASFARTNNAGYIDRLHYAKMKPLKFDAVDVVAEQIKQLRLSPTWRITYSYLKKLDGKKREKRLLAIYSKVMNFLSQYRELGDREARIVEKIVRDAASEAERTCRGLGMRAERLAVAASIYVARLVLGIAGIDLYRLREELGLEPKDIDSVLSIVRRLSVKYRVDRYGLIARSIDSVAESLGKPLLATVAKTLLSVLEIGGKSTRGITAGLIYIASLLLGDGVRQEDICRILRCSEVLVRLNYRSIAKRLGIEIEQNRVYAVTRITIPRHLCEDLNGIELASYVTCR